MADIKWAPYGSIATVMTTELNGLANATRAVSGERDNSTDLYVYADLELVVTFASAPTADTVCELYLIPSIDGTTYTDGETTTIQPAATEFVGAFYVRNVTSAQRIAVRGVVIPPGKRKWVLRNFTGVAMAASGNTLKERLYRLQVA